MARYPFTTQDMQQIQAAYDAITRVGNETATGGGTWDDLLDRAQQDLGLILAYRAVE